MEISLPMQKLFLAQTNRFYSWHFGESLYFLIHPIICLTSIRLRCIESPYNVTPEIIWAKFTSEDRKRKSVKYSSDAYMHLLYKCNTYTKTFFSNHCIVAVECSMTFSPIKKKETFTNSSAWKLLVLVSSIIPGA